MLDWLWWLGARVLWMSVGAFCFAMMLLWLHLGDEDDARIWRADEEARRWKR